MSTVTRQTSDRPINQSRPAAAPCSTTQHPTTPRNTNNAPITYDHRSPNNISYKRYR